MSVFLIRDADVEQRIVEAPSFGLAIELWRARLIAEWIASGDYVDEDELHMPVSVELIADEPVIRRLCRACGCADDTACGKERNDPCSWATLDLCSACAKEAGLL